MDYQTTQRKYLSVSAVKVQGVCETKVLETIEGKAAKTPAMKAGIAAHEKLAEALPKISKEEIIESIRSGKAADIRELPVFDPKLHITGRIDHLSVTGMIENGKNTAIVIDDKFPNSTSAFHGFTLYYKLQLAAYAAALANSYEYGNICRIVGARLIYRDRQTGNATEQYNMGRERLETCVSNVGMAADNVWRVYRRQQEPVHRRFDVEKGEWIGYFCNADNGKA